MPAAPPAVDAPSLTEGVEAWSTLCAKLDARAQLDAEIIDLAGRVQSSGTIESVEGMPLEQVLSQTHRLTQAERRMLLTAADVLRHMPATRRFMADGLLSFSQVRGIVAEGRRLNAAERAALDATLAASADRIGKMDPDDVIDAVRVAALELRDPSNVERREKAQARGNFLSIQPGMFGRGTTFGEFDNVSLSSLAIAVDAMAPEHDGRSRAQRRAEGLIDLARHRCDDPDETSTENVCAPVDGDAADEGHDADATGRPTRHPRLHKALPDVTVLLDWREITPHAAGMLTINAPGYLPTISAALLESLAADGATVRAIVCDGAQPLFVTKTILAKQVPAKVRRAVLARDRRDRFPGSRRTIEHLHHAKLGSGQDLNRIVGLSEVSHKIAHRHGWKLTLDPSTAEITFSRGERSWTTLPRGTRLRRPPPADEDAA